MNDELSIDARVFYLNQCNIYFIVHNKCYFIYTNIHIHIHIHI